MRVTFLNPAGTGDVFYEDMVALMRVAADGLDIELEVIECNRELAAMRSRAREVVSRAGRPDAAIVVNDRSIALELIPVFSVAGIETLLLCEGLMLPDRFTLGGPGEKHASWIGELLPDDQEAGQHLVERLLGQAAALGLVATDGRIHVAGLGGNYSSASILRISGLRRGLEADRRALLGQIAPSSWSRSVARNETRKLVESDAEIGVLWAANDAMALGAVETLEELGRVPGKDVVVGGIDWSPFAIEEVRRGRFGVSIGGHFADGAWALVLLHDHHHGRPLTEVAIKSQLVALSRDNVGRYEQLLDRKVWGRLDFARLSRVRNPAAVALRPGIEPIRLLLDRPEADPRPIG